MSTILRVVDSLHVHSHCGTEPVEVESPTPDDGSRCLWECCSCGLMRFVNISATGRDAEPWQAGHEALAADYLSRYGALDGLDVHKVHSQSPWTPN